MNYCNACFFPRGEIEFTPRSSTQADDGMEPAFSEPIGEMFLTPPGTMTLTLPLVAAGVIAARLIYEGPAKPIFDEYVVPRPQEAK